MSGSRKYPTEVFLIDESIDPEEFIIATYALYGNPKDYLTLTGALALEQTTGTWVPVAEETPEVRRKHGGKVVSAFEVGIPKKEEGQPRIFVIKIAFPIVNLGYRKKCQNTPQLAGGMNGRGYKGTPSPYPCI